MELILPRQPALPPDTQLDRLAGLTLRPFDTDVVAFVTDFAHRILSDHALRAAPELIALGFWFRPAAIEALRHRHRDLARHVLIRPRGVVFHIAPANVDAVFVYAWFLSLLCGNRNIVRLSRRDNAHRTQLLDLLDEVLAAHPRVADANAVVAYERDDEVSTALSARCMLRVVWGGNDTVAHIRRLPLPPLATELAFPDRQSWALLDANAVVDIEDTTLATLAKAFYNDAFWFAQQACSSPRAVLWIGAPKAVGAARRRFWRALGHELARRGERPDASELAARLVAAHCAAAEGAVSLNGRLDDYPLQLNTPTFSPALRSGHCGYGLFYELSRITLDETHALFCDADQTVAYFGFNRETLASWAMGLPDRAIDRIVPVGEALRFSDRWDGHDLLLAFSRQVVIE